MTKDVLLQIVLLVLTLISAIFVIINVFTDWVRDIYPIGIMLSLLLLDSAWRNGYAEKRNEDGVK